MIVRNGGLQRPKLREVRVSERAKEILQDNRYQIASAYVEKAVIDLKSRRGINLLKKQEAYITRNYKPRHFRGQASRKTDLRCRLHLHRPLSEEARMYVEVMSDKYDLSYNSFIDFCIKSEGGDI